LWHQDSAGAIQNGNYTWDGRVNSVYVGDGIYYFRISTQDIYGNSSYRMIEVIKNRVPAQISFPLKVDAQGNTTTVGNIVVIKGIAVDPGIDNPQDFNCYKLWFQAGENIDFGLPVNDPTAPSETIWHSIPVPIFYQDPNDALYHLSNKSVKTVMNSVLGYWDTRVLAPGRYTLLLTTTDKSGHSSYDFCTVDIVEPSVDLTTPAISITNPPIDLSPYLFAMVNPDDALNIAYSLTRTSDVSMDIVRMSGNAWGQVVFHQDSFAQNINGGFIWDGKNQLQANFVDDGAYKILLTACDVDCMGVTTTAADIIFQRQLESPIKIVKLVANPETIAPGDMTHIQYEISKPAWVTITLLDFSGQIVQTLVYPDTIQPAGILQDITYTASAEGLYTCKLSAIAASDTTAAEASIPLVVQSASGSGIASITSPGAGEVLQGKTLLNWSASAKGDYYPPQTFYCSVTVQGTESYYPAQPAEFDWKIRAEADEVVSRSGSVFGHWGGEREFHPTRSDGTPIWYVFFWDPFGGQVAHCNSYWSAADVGYDVTFVDAPNPTVTVDGSFWSIFGQNSRDLFVYPSRTGFSVKAWVADDVHEYPHGCSWTDQRYHKADQWPKTVSQVRFDWSVTGKITDKVIVELSGHSSANSESSTNVNYSGTISPKHSGYLTNLNIVEAHLDTYWPGIGSDDYDNNINNVRTYTPTNNTFTPIPGTPSYTLSGSIPATNTTQALLRPWSKAFTLDSSNAATPSSQWATAFPYCYYNHPLASKILTSYFTPPLKHQSYRIPKYLCNPHPSNNSQVNLGVTGDILTSATNYKDSSWTTNADHALDMTHGEILQKDAIFNDTPDYSRFITETTPQGISSAYPLANVDMAASAAIKNKYTFWKSADGLAVIDNPFIGIDADDPAKGWNVKLSYPDGNLINAQHYSDYETNKNYFFNTDHESLPNTAVASGNNPIDINDMFGVRLTKGTAPQRFAIIKGQTSSWAQGFKAYALYCQKVGTSTWMPLTANGNTPVASGGILGYWNTTSLQDGYTLRLLVWDGSGITEDLKTITVGKSVAAGQQSYVTSPCNKAYLSIPIDSLTADATINISPVRASDMNLVIDPALPQPIGPIYKLQPEGLTFSAQNPAWFSVRLLPEEMAGVDPGLINVYYLKDDGTIESLDIPSPSQELTDDAIPINVTRVACPITHFSHYMLIPGIKPPVLNSLTSPTNVNPASVSGTAEAKSWIEMFVNGALVGKGQADNLGNFILPVTLTEGTNQISAKATRKFANGSQTSKPSQQVTVVLDTQAPVVDSLVVSPNPFSPNGDGMNDTTQISFINLEPAAVDLQILTANGAIVRSLLHDQLLGVGGHTQVWDGKNTLGQYVSQGEYFVEIIVKDAAGNQGRYRQRVVALNDTEAPETMLIVGQPHYIDTTGNTLLAAATSLTLQAVDSGSGISKLRYRINSGFWQDKYTSAYSFSLPAEDGIYQLDYLSFDKQDNADILHSQQLLLDNTGPDVSLKVNAPSVIRDGATYISGNTLLELLAADPVVNQVSSGVQNTYYQVDGQSFVQGNNFALGQLPDGEHNVGCYAVDNVGNSGAVNASKLVLDNTSPISTLNHSEQYFQWHGGLYVSPACIFNLAAVDAYSGVSATALQIDGGVWQYNSVPFHLLKGAHVLNYYAIDHVGNSEIAQSVTIQVPLPDTTPPVTTLAIGDPKYSIPGTQPVETLATTHTAFTLSAVDILGPNDGVALGVDYTLYAVNTTGVMPTTSDWQTYSSPIYLSNSGLQYFWYRSIDLGGNTETARCAIVCVKTTTPDTVLSIPSPDNTGVCRVINGTVKIYGTAQDQYFANYTLSLISSSGTRQLVSVTNTVKDGILAVWDTKAFESGEYQLILDAKDLLGQESIAQTTVVLHEPALKQLITYGQEKGRDDDKDDCEGEHIRPQYIAQDKDGNIYVSDLRKCAYKLDPSGTQILARYPKDNKHAHEKKGLIHPQGIAVDGQGFVYIVDQARNCVNKYTNTGEFAKTYPGKSSTKKLHSPQGMTLGTDGLLYIADKLNERVVVIDQEFNFIKEIRFTGQVTAACHHPSNGLRPTDVAIFGNVLYVTDEHANKVYKFRLADNACVGVIGREGNKRGEFKQPQGISTNLLGYWYVSDTGNGRIIKYNVKDEVVAVWAIREIQRGRYLNGSALGVHALANGEVLAADVKLGNVKRYGLGDTLVPLPGAITTSILSPASGSLVNGNVHIFGTAKTADYCQFAGFELSYKPTGGQEKTITKQNSIKEQELLTVWNATHLTSGNYELKLTVKNKAGQQKSAVSSVTVGDWSTVGQIGTGSRGTGNNQFNTPWDVDIDHYGQLYIADNGNDRVQKFNQQDQYLATLGSSGTRPGELKRPTNMAVDNQDRLYVVDSGNRRVQVLDLNGNYIKEYTSGLKWPASVALDEKGIVHILDSDGKIYYLDNQGNLKSIAAWPSGVTATCYEPTGNYSDLAAAWSDAYGNTVTKYFDRVHIGEARVEKLNANGENIFAYKGACGEYLPQNIMVGPVGNIWITDSANHRVQEFGPFGNLLGTFGSFGSRLGKFDRPHGIAFKQADNQVMAYVVDTGNQRVQKFAFTASGLPTPVPSMTPTVNLEIAGLRSMPDAFIAEVGEKTVISYLVTKPAQVSLTIVDQNGAMIRDLGSRSVDAPGMIQDIIWDGRNNFGQIVKPQQYIIRAEAIANEQHYTVTAYVTILAKGQEPPTPQPSPTQAPATPVLTGTPVNTSTPVPTATPTKTNTPEPTWTPTPTKTWTPSPEPTPTWTPEPELTLTNDYANPNPFTCSTRIHYTLNLDAQVNITLTLEGGHDVQHYGPFAPGTDGGRKGENEVQWDGSKLNVVHAACHEEDKKYLCTITAQKGSKTVQKQFEIVKRE
jgi:sugar lactone lactonase YvrE